MVTTPARPPAAQVSWSRYSGKPNPSIKEDAAYWTLFMARFEAARGTPVATIKHVADMYMLMDEVRASLLPAAGVAITVPCLRTPSTPHQYRTRPCVAPAPCPSAST